MTEPALSLRSFLSDDAAAPVADALDMGPLAAAVTPACAAIPGSVASDVLQSLRGVLDEALHVELGHVLTHSWGKVAALRTALKSTRDDPTTLAVVPLLDHKITSRHAPHVDLMYGAQSLLQAPLEVVLSLELKGVTLHVEKGRISGLKAGHCVGEASVTFLGQPLAKQKSREFGLPGRLNLAAQPEPEPDPTPPPPTAPPAPSVS